MTMTMTMTITMTMTRAGRCSLIYEYLERNKQSSLEKDCGALFHIVNIRVIIGERVYNYLIIISRNYR